MRIAKHYMQGTVTVSYQTPWCLVMMVMAKYHMKNFQWPGIVQCFHVNIGTSDISHTADSFCTLYTMCNMLVCYMTDVCSRDWETLCLCVECLVSVYVCVWNAVCLCVCLCVERPSKSEDLRSRSCPYLDTINRLTVVSLIGAGLRVFCNVNPWNSSTRHDR